MRRASTPARNWPIFVSLISAALPDGYSSAKRLHAGQLSEVYSAIRDRDGAEVILKLYAGDSASARLASAQREFEVLRALAGKGIPEAYEVILEHVTPVLVTQRARGVSMGAWVATGLPSVGSFLTVASQLAEALERVHVARFIHCDVNPWNIVVDPATLETYLIDFGLARRLGSAERSTAGSSGGLEGTLLYIAPEQTGRMNRGTDLRSDLYSLGAAFYQALTGRPPFESNDPLELIHAHIARMPVAPAQLRAELPQVISDLVLKLLRKEPEERYTNAGVLHADLELLREQLERTGRIEPGFELAATEAPDSPRFSRKLHGRTREIAALHALKKRVTSGRAPALLLQGEAGCGKSALVDELRPWLAEVGGYLVSGGFDLYRDRPYAGWESALGSLIQQLLVESDARLEQWKTELHAGLGNIAQALVDLLPDLQFVVGDVPPVPALGPRETQARLSLALQRFLGVCASKNRPLVLLLDDLQWSDAGSRFLLEDLLCSELPEGLLLICAYRSGDVAAGHPLTALFARLTERRIPVESLTLGALDAQAGVEMLAEALARPIDEIRSLGQLVERKTGNNPVLMRQFVEHIHARGLLRWQRGQGWSWDPSEIAASDIPDGAVALMTEKIGRLEPAARSLIEFASCVGDEFDLDVLTELGRAERTVLEQGLYALSDAGLIAPCPNGFRFVHGRIREAAQSLLADDARARLHYDMARLLLARTLEAEQPQRVFEIVEHLNRGLAHVGDDMRLTAIRLNVAAGKRALGSGAAATSEGYLGIARRLLREEDWSSERALGFELYLQSAESALLRRDFEGSLALLADLDACTPSLMESTHIEVKRIQVFVLTQPPEQCTRYALEVLRRHGIRWPMHPSPLRARLALRRLLWKLRPGTRRELLYRATKVDPSWLAPIMITGASGGVMTRVDVHLVVLVSCWLLDSNLRRGYVARPSFSLAAYATWIQVVLGNAPESERLTQLAQEWGEKVPDPAFKPRVDMQLHAILRPWWTRRRQTLAAMDRVAESMREIGDLEYAYYARFLKIAYGALAGENVADAERDFAELADAVRRSGQRYPEPERCHAVYRMLLGATPGEFEAARSESKAWIQANGGSAQVYIRTFWMLVLCLHNRFEEVIVESDPVQQMLFSIVPYVHVADHTFLRGIACAALATKARGALRRRYLKDLKACHRRVREWARHGPDFVHMEMLLSAEQARLRGDANGARALYDKAAQRAKDQEYVHHAALACERRARMLATLRRETEAGASLREAVALYAKWGSLPKAESLEQERKTLIGG
jgi:hypothetical protein